MIPTKTADDGHAVRVLIVDDDADTRAGLAVLCSQAGMQTDQAGSVSEAREAIEQSVPDAVISDLVMPDEDGFALLPTLSASEDESGHHIASVLVTGQSDPEIRRRALAAGFDAFLTKPYDSTTIVLTLNRLVRAGVAKPIEESLACPKPRRAARRRAPRES
jgi:CheY-like chemotaxis protein